VRSEFQKMGYLAVISVEDKLKTNQHSVARIQVCKLFGGASVCAAGITPVCNRWVCKTVCLYCGPRIGQLANTMLQCPGITPKVAGQIWWWQMLVDPDYVVGFSHSALQ
jgi:hypothetical protein